MSKFGHAPRIFVIVTKEAIDNGVARNSNHCMIAESLKERYPQLRYVSVDIQTIRATDPEKKERYVWLTPRAAQKMIIDFDAGRRPQPFSFHCRDGQVTDSGKTYDPVEAKKKRRKVLKAKLRMARGGNKQTVPERIGGKTPPRSVGQRRSFGLRSLVL